MDFANRHIGPDSEDIRDMLVSINKNSISELIDSILPGLTEDQNGLDLMEPMSENGFLKYAQSIASMNKNFRSYIGMGYVSSLTPTVIQRNILEDPGWYTQYTPYQSEISQGRLEE